MNNTTIKQAGFDRNGHGRLYSRGAEYSTAQKLEFEELYWQMVTSGGGKHPSVRIFARECRVGRTFANKLIREIKDSGTVMAVEDLKEKRRERRATGVGSNSLTRLDEEVLLHLREINPARSNNSYVSSLFHLTGTVISSSFISEFFRHIGPYKGNFRVMSKVPIDKYRASNIVTYAD